MTIEALLERIAIALEKSNVAAPAPPEVIPEVPAPKPRGRPRKDAAPVAVEETPPVVVEPEVVNEERVYTEGDVRNALVALQTTTGSRDKSMEILGKYSNGGTTLGKLPPKSYAAVIQACIAAGAAA